MLCYLAITRVSHDMELQTEGTSVHRGSSLSEDIYLFLTQVVIEDFLCASHSRRHGKSLGARGAGRQCQGKHQLWCRGFSYWLPCLLCTSTLPQCCKPHIIPIRMKTGLHVALITITIQILQICLLSFHLMSVPKSEENFAQVASCKP